MVPKLNKLTINCLPEFRRKIKAEKRKRLHFVLKKKSEETNRALLETSGAPLMLTSSRVF
jgi:hypothetical protein